MVVKVEQLKNMMFDNEWLAPDDVEYIKKCYKKDNRVFFVLGIVLISLTLAILGIALSGVAGDLREDGAFYFIIAVAVPCILMGIICFIVGNKRQKRIEECLDNHNYNVKNTGITRIQESDVGYMTLYSCECYGIPGTWGIFDRKRAKTLKPGHYVKFVVMWSAPRTQKIFVLIKDNNFAYNP